MISVEKSLKTLNFKLSFGEIFSKLCIFYLVLQSLIAKGQAIKCYKCAVTTERNYSYSKNTTTVTPICSKFDESDEYIVDCPYSTMCLKTISKLQLQNGQQTEAVTRGCAPQKDTKQVFNNGQWRQQHSVQEVYEEGCTEFTENTMTASVKTHCYCRGKLCNSTNSLISKFHTVAVIVLFGFLLSYLKS